VLISEKGDAAKNVLIASSTAAPTIVCDQNDDWLVQKVTELLQQDFSSVTGKTPAIEHQLKSTKQPVIVIGTVDKSALIKKIIQQKQLNVDQIKNKWEAFQYTTSGNTLIIAGSDKRGAAFGALELSRQMGVSPWYWWADVPAKKKQNIYFRKGTQVFGSPSVKYRGIFINDEAPAFSGWTKEKFGGVNHLVYEKIFELLLRLKANYLWPAMWGNAFNDDDSLNPILADKWGIVMGTSHHEPMLRAQQEWKRYGKGPWNYDSNEVVLKDFWRKGIEHMGTHESIVTIGMRGDGDKPMTQGTAINLLERIVGDQRKIIEDVTKKPASQTPQLWALYKEVQDYYDQGMRVPDDVTLLLCDDNWGNIRKLPKLTDAPRKGGYGIYYHFDYVGGPRNYKWINTNNIARVWEQMHLAYEYDVRQIWIVNVGDLKPMEFPISFFLDYAYDVKKWNEDNLRNYYTKWAAEQFGPSYAEDIGEIIQKYSQFNARRKPELLSPETYSLSNYNEFATVMKDYNDLAFVAQKTDAELPHEYKDAFFEMVLHPVEASANLNEMYFYTALNHEQATRNSPAANSSADRVLLDYKKDSLLSVQYHQTANGKWNHMMDQTHIGYTYWQQPPRNKMPNVTYVTTDSVNRSSRVVAENVMLSETEADPMTPKLPLNSFIERDGYVSMEAVNTSKRISSANLQWKVIPDIGRTGSGITTFPVTALVTIASNSPHLEYEFYSYDSANAKINLYFSPTLNFRNDEGLKYAISIDNETPQIFSLNKEDNNVRTWEGWVANNIIIKTSEHKLSKPGKHVIKYWMISPAVVLQKIVVDFGGMTPSYLGPPQTLVTN
jgi:hypothetical protein